VYSGGRAQIETLYVKGKASLVHRDPDYGVSTSPSDYGVSVDIVRLLETTHIAMTSSHTVMTSSHTVMTSSNQRSFYDVLKK